MASSLLDICRYNPTLGGTTDWTFSSIVTGYQSPASAGVVNGATYSYRAESTSLTEWEIGTGTYNTGTGVLSRTTILFSSNANAKVTFSAAPQVAIVALAEDLRGCSTPQGRLTLQTGVPVMTTTQSAKTTIFYTPYVGNQFPLYDGTNMVAVPFTEISVATTDTTKSPAAIGVGKVNDWFVWNDSGTIRLSHGPDWTNNTTRSAGTALVMVNGILLNSVSITNGPAASRGTFVGTTLSDASSQLDWIFGTIAAGGGAAFFGVWNTYNRRPVETIVSDSTDSWTYSGVFRAANASSAMRATYVTGQSEDAFSATYFMMASGTAGNSALGGIGFDVTNALSGISAANAGTTFMTVPGTFAATTSLGAHFMQAIESCTGTGTFFGDAGVPASFQSGLTFRGMM